MEDGLFTAVDPLPRGPHQLAREEVEASQRERLIAAFTALLAERGYAAVTIGDLAKTAGVSRGAFYAQFEDKEACLMAAYDRFASNLMAAITAAPEDAGFHEFVEAAIDGYLGALEREPVAARAFLVEMDGAGPAARQRRREGIRAFAAMLAHRHGLIREREPRLGPLPESVFLGLAMGVRELAQDLLEQEAEPRLTDLGPDVMTWVVA
ncbi:MAG: hypothetical protein QOG62_1290, partial [Thermoleophilaceae bacterium]|nr:hypothetical protein [Thermoleophilaceae bacterium]